MLEIDETYTDPDVTLWRGSVLTGYPLYREDVRTRALPHPRTPARSARAQSSSHAH